jgi:hypothetical protein
LIQRGPENRSFFSAYITLSDKKCFPGKPTDEAACILHETERSVQIISKIDRYRKTYNRLDSFTGLSADFMQAF